MPTATTLIIIGATGDLTGRLLLPALARLTADGDLGADFAVLGAGPQRWRSEVFREHARARLAAHASDLALADRESFLTRIDYEPVDVSDPASVARLLAPHLGAGEVVLYLALPTTLVTTTVAALQPLNLPPGLRIAVEKPFGEDLAGAQELNALLRRINPAADSVFRVDHVLGMPTVATLPSLWPASPVIPHDARITEVSILWEETLALEGRAAFYDRAGALKDLLQNHLLQLLCLITMDEEAHSERIADRRWRALQAVRVPGESEAVANSRRARYTAGRLATPDGTLVPDYVDEPGVDPTRQTETLAEVVLEVASPEWSGTRFVLRAGKAMSQRRRGILVQYRTGPAEEVRSSWIDVDEPSSTAEPAADPSNSRSAPLEQVAYSNVLRGLLSGNQELSVSARETERAWEIFAPVLRAWALGQVPLEEYPAGSAGLRTDLTVQKGCAARPEP